MTVYVRAEESRPISFADISETDDALASSFPKTTISECDI